MSTDTVAASAPPSADGGGEEKSIYLLGPQLVPGSMKKPKTTKQEDPTDVLFTGALNKKGGTFGNKSWAHRFFVLQRNGQLMYFKKEKEYERNPDKPRGTIPIGDQGVYVVDQSITKRKLGFQIVLPPHPHAKEQKAAKVGDKHSGIYVEGRTYYLEAPDKVAKMDWLEVLERVNPTAVPLARVGGYDYSGWLQVAEVKKPLDPASSTTTASKALSPPTSPSHHPALHWKTRFVVLRANTLSLFESIKDHFPPVRVGHGQVLSLQRVNLRGNSVLAQTPRSFVLTWRLDTLKRELHFKEIADRRTLPKNQGDIQNLHKSRFYTGRDTEDWIEALGEGIPDKVFGVSLGLACVRSVVDERVVPRCVLVATEWLSQHGTQERGLFRIPGSREQVEAFIERFDRAENVVIDAKEQPGNIASLLVQFFKRMPENIFTEQYAPVFTKVCSAENKSNPKKLEMLTKLVNMLPAANRDTIKVLVKHLAVVASHSEVNEMTAAKLSMCVYSSNAKALQTLIEHHATVFGGEEDDIDDGGEARSEQEAVEEGEEEERAEEEDAVAADAIVDDDPKDDAITPAADDEQQQSPLAEEELEVEEGNQQQQEEEQVEETSTAAPLEEAQEEAEEPEKEQEVKAEEVVVKSRFCSQCGSKLPATTTTKICDTCTSVLQRPSRTDDPATSGGEEDTSDDDSEA